MRGLDQGGLVFFPEYSVVWGKPGKTAGTSLLEVFSKRFGEPVTFKADPIAYRGLLNTPLDDLIRIVTVRNPFTRFASLWRYSERVHWIRPSMPFGEFASKFVGYFGQYSIFRAHARPVVNYLDELDLPKTLRVESLQDDVDDLMFGLGLGPIEVPRRNVDERPALDLADLYRNNPDAAQFVRKFYCSDFGDDCSTPMDRHHGFTYLATTESL